jgi:hypothetical protein
VLHRRGQHDVCKPQPYQAQAHPPLLVLSHAGPSICMHVLLTYHRGAIIMLKVHTDFIE